MTTVQFNSATGFDEPSAWPALEPERVPASCDWTTQQRHPARMAARTVRPASASEATDPRSLLPQEPLTPLSRSWMRDLPLKVRPGLTAERHPHVVNRLAAAWADAVLMEACFGDLMLADRLGRKGFSLDVLDELVTLQGYSQARRQR